MQVVINIPKEFEGDWNDTRFADCIHRAMIDLMYYPEHTKMTGKYEMETLGMLRDAFENGKVLPKGHGDLIDKTKIKAVELDNPHNRMSWYRGDETDLWIEADTVIPADKERE